MTTPINRALMHLSRRAETNDATTLVDTFVNVGPLFTLVRSNDHQIIYGRRGTGKTHALRYLAQDVRDGGDLAIYLDMRTVGSTGGIHADQGVPIPERGTRLLVDTLGVIHDELVNFALEEADAGRIGAQTLPLLDRLADEITRVRVVGETRREAVASEERTSSSSVDAGAAFGGPSVVSARLGASGEESRSGQLRITTEDTGQTVHRVHFGAVSSLLAAVAASLDVARVWILVDEWSDLPLDLQPLLADLIRRSVFPVARVTVKIGAIEQRSEFSKQAGAGGYIGIEVGADAAADIDLDDFMVFGNDAEKAKDFFRELIYKHVRSLMIEASDDPPPNANALISRAFTQQPAFAEFVRAAEGVPRDAINIAIQAAQLADDRQISINESGRPPDVGTREISKRPSQPTTRRSASFTG